MTIKQTLPNNKPNMMSFYQEETIYFFQGLETAYILQGKALQEINCFRSLQERNPFLPSKTHDIGCLYLLHFCNNAFVSV